MIPTSEQTIVLQADGRRFSFDKSVLPWNTATRSPWSLWDMIETGVWHLVNHTASLTRTRENLQERRFCDHPGYGHQSGAFTDNDKQSICLVLDLMSPWLEALSLNSSLDRVNRIREFFDEGHDEYALSDVMVVQLEVLSQTLEDELKRHTFIYLSPAEVKMYRDPYGAFPKTIRMFPSTGHDIIGAIQCYTLGQGGACVFHCMGILQYGLYALADELKVEFKTPIELENWKNIIEPIEKRIKAIENDPKSKQKDDDLKFYSQAAVQFRYFKDAWRNHVCHLRQQYDIHQAQSVLQHVTDFMETISTRLRESASV
jgi:hypothetical protein